MTSKSSITITPLVDSDYEAWLTLWQNYLSFYETSLAAETTDCTWRKIIDSEIAIYGFGARIAGVLVGITHVVLHPNTWNTTDCCYLEDLYVDGSVRGQGVGRTLIEYVYDFAKQRGCNRVYWTTQQSNTPARILYDHIASQTDMVQYRKDL